MPDYDIDNGRFVLKKIICIITAMLMAIAMIPYTALEVAAEDIGIGDGPFDFEEGVEDWPPIVDEDDKTTEDDNDKEPDTPAPDCTHSFKLTKIDKATLTEDGLKTLSCALCEEIKTETIPRIETVELLFPRVNYDGKVKTPEVVAVDGAGEVIDAKNYTVDYPKNIKKVGAYKVKVAFIGDIYEGSETLTFAVVRPAPKTAKIQLSTAKGGYDDVVYSWSKVPYAKGYRIYYKKASSSKYTLYKTTNSNKTTKITKKNLTDGVKYNFKVVSYVVIDGKKYESANAKVFSIYTLKKLPTPKVAKSGTKVKVTWTNINGDTGYQISQAKKKSGTNIVATYKTTKGTYKTLTAKKGAKYYYKVRVYKTYKVGSKYVKVYGPWSDVKAYKR